MSNCRQTMMKVAIHNFYSFFYLIKSKIHEHTTNRMKSNSKANTICGRFLRVSGVHCSWDHHEYIFQSVSFEIVNRLDDYYYETQNDYLLIHFFFVYFSFYGFSY